MDVEATLVRCGFALVEHGRKFVPGNNPARSANKEFQNIEFDPGEIQGTIIPPRKPGMGVDAHPARFDLSRSGGADADSPQHGANARQQFFGTERFGQVVIRTCIEPCDAVTLFGSRSKHDDGYSTTFADLMQYGETVEHGEHYVEDDDVELALDGAL